MPLATRNTSAETIRNAALDAFFDFGYHGTSTREIVKRAGIGVATLYHHYPSKEDVLAEIVQEFFGALESAVVDAVDAAGPEPAARLEAYVRARILFHLAHQREAFVAHADFRSLGPEHRALVEERRRNEQGFVERLLRQGQRARSFDVPRPADATRALLQMTTGVMSWYRRGGPLTPDDVADAYVRFARSLVGTR